MKTYRVDIDGTLCNKTYGRYDQAIPYLDKIREVNKLYDAGHKIIIWTRRSVRDWRKLTEAQMKEWGVKHHELSFDKPYFDVLFDDKAKTLEIEKKNNVSKQLGRMKVWQTRLAGYISIINFIMIFYLYIIESPMGFEWYHWALLIVFGVTAIIYVDTKFIMPQSFGYVFAKNPEMRNLKQQSQENSEKLDLILTHLSKNSCKSSEEHE